MQVTVVPSDAYIIVNGDLLQFGFVAPPDIHAVQWDNSQGTIELVGGGVRKAVYAEDVAPFVTLWEEEKKRRESHASLTLEEVKSLKRQEIDAIASAKITAGFWYQDASLMDNALHFSFGLDDQANFSSAMNGANLSLILSMTAGEVSADVPHEISWNGYSDEEHQVLVPVVFDASQFIAFWVHAETVHKNTLLGTARAHKQNVDAAQSVEVVNAILWE